MSTVSVIPYLSFAGDCEEAINTYIAAFGGEIYYLSRWSAENCRKPEQVGKVMHVEFAIGGTRMAAGDSYESKGADTSVKLMIHMASKDEALKAVAVLADGGEILAPLAPHPAPDDDSCGAMVRDRFGYRWIFTCPNPDKPA